MEIIDKHYKLLSNKNKSFLWFTLTGFNIISVIAFIFNVFSLIEMLFMMIFAAVFVQLLKLEYRIEDLEKKHKRGK